MKRKVKQLPPPEYVLDHFRYHEEVYTRGWRECIGGLERLSGQKTAGTRYAGGVDRLGYLRTVIPGHKGLFAVHRLVWLLHRGSLREGFVMDHINGNPSDNRIANLREVPDAINQMNRRGSRRGSSVKYIGVCRNGNGFNAFSSSEGKVVYLGRYGSELEAARVRDRAVATRHGGRAVLNRDLFPEDFCEMSDPLI